MKERYKALYDKIIWPSGPTEVQFETGPPPPQNLISNVNAVPLTANGRWILIQFDDGTWDIPGGTVEADEKPMDALARELLEEAGAKLLTADYIGTWQMHSFADKPYRPHLSHPITYRVVYRCKVELVSQPQIPETGGKNVVAVDAVSLTEVVARFASIDRHDLAELYQFAADTSPGTGRHLIG